MKIFKKLIYRLFIENYEKFQINTINLKNKTIYEKLNKLLKTLTNYKKLMKDFKNFKIIYVKIQKIL